MTGSNRNESDIDNSKKSSTEGHGIPTTNHLHASISPEIALTAKTRYISILGSGAPGTDEFYRKMAFITDIASSSERKGYAPDAVPVIEILYWYPEDAESVNIADFYSVNPIPSLLYRMMVRIHDNTVIKDIEHAHSAIEGSVDFNIKELEIFTLPEQLVVQVMHIGPFANEFGTLERLGALADYHGVSRSGPHHEIHLDPFTRSTPQDKLRTILRDPVT